MTVTYSATKSFLLLLFKWKGSVWKAVIFQCFEYVVFLALWYGLNLSYRFAMSEPHQIYFEKVVKFFASGNGFIPVQFLLGFYVSRIIANWWDQLNCIAWPDKFLVFVTGNLHGQDEESRLLRRTFARYSNLLSTLVWREISLKIKKRFPTDQHLIDAGLMSEEEHQNYMASSGTYGRWFIPVCWMNQLLAKTKEAGKISDYAHQKLMEELWAFRSGSAMLTMYDWINIPLVYTQVVTLATYGYFFFSLIGRQALITGRKNNQGVVIDPDEVQLYFPLFTTLEFLFYIGWLKVGEQLRCPFGEDDDDFDMNFILDRNIHVSHMITHSLPGHAPVVSPVAQWAGPDYPSLPHTLASYRVRDPIPPWRLGTVRFRPRDMRPWSDDEVGGGLVSALTDRVLSARGGNKLIPMHNVPHRA